MHTCCVLLMSWPTPDKVVLTNDKMLLSRQTVYRQTCAYTAQYCDVIAHPVSVSVSMTVPVINSDAKLPQSTQPDMSACTWCHVSMPRSSAAVSLPQSVLLRMQYIRQDQLPYCSHRCLAILAQTKLDLHFFEFISCV
jgi:hypothetical protein